MQTLSKPEQPTASAQRCIDRLRGDYLNPNRYEFLTAAERCEHLAETAWGASVAFDCVGDDKAATALYEISSNSHKMARALYRGLAA